MLERKIFQGVATWWFKNLYKLPRFRQQNSDCNQIFFNKTYFPILGPAWYVARYSVDCLHIAGQYWSLYSWMHNITTACMHAWCVFILIPSVSVELKKPGGPLATKRTIYGSHTWSGGTTYGSKNCRRWSGGTTYGGVPTVAWQISTETVLVRNYHTDTVLKLVRIEHFHGLRRTPYSWRYVPVLTE